MKRRIFIGMLLVLPLGLWAEGHGLQLAPKGGVTQWKNSQMKSSMDGMGGMDIGYVVRWRAANNTQVGLRSGLGINYSQTAMDANFTEEYDRVDYMDRTLHYTTMASVSEQHQHWQLEIPAMFTLKCHGVTVDLGPKVMFMLMDNFSQTVDKASIDAYLPLYKVHIRDEKPTGQLTTPYQATRSCGLPSMAITLSAAIGYEWQFGNQYSRTSIHFVGIQAFADYGVYSYQFAKQDAFLSVAPITATRQTPKVTVGTIPATTPVQFLNLGIRVYYTIQSVDYPEHDWHRHRND